MPVQLRKPDAILRVSRRCRCRIRPEVQALHQRRQLVPADLRPAPAPYGGSLPALEPRVERPRAARDAEEAARTRARREERRPRRQLVRVVRDDELLWGGVQRGLRAGGERVRVEGVDAEVRLRVRGVRPPRGARAQVDADAGVPARKEDVREEAVAASEAYLNGRWEGKLRKIAHPKSRNPPAGRPQARQGSSGGTSEAGGGGYVSFHKRIRNVAMPMS